MAKLKGATLIETLAAMTIIVVVSALAFTLFNSVLGNTKGIRDLKAQFLADRYLDQVIENDVEDEYYLIERSIKEIDDSFNEITVTVNYKGKSIVTQKTISPNK